MYGEPHISTDMNKVKRSISGIYFRYKNGESWENWCFEDLPADEQDDILRNKSHEFIVGLAKILADTINNLCDQLDLTREYHEDSGD